MKLQIEPRLRRLVEEHGGEVAFAHGLHRARETFATRGELHAETLAGFLHPAFGRGLVKRAVDDDPFALRQFGAEERRGGHHLHEREVRHEEDRARCPWAASRVRRPACFHPR
jgi:hypothetical protein